MNDQVTPNGSKGLICITDDDRFLLEMYAVKFVERGYTVDTTFSGQEMLDSLAGGAKPRACLIDIVMPNMDGFELLGKIKERNLCQGIPIIILSNLGQKEDIERGLSLGATSYIVKANATPTEVVDRVEEIISGAYQAK